MGCIQSGKRHLYTDNEKQLSVTIESKPAAENRPELSEEHKIIVRETWNVIKLDISRIGVVMFMRLFEKYPDVQQLFVHFRGLSSTELQNNKKLRDHGLRVLNTLDKCITRIDDTERLEKLLLELGQKHVMFNIKVEYLYLLIPQLQQSLMPVLGDSWTYLVESAWSAFLKYIIHIMAEGMVS
ncbi:cytoglobin-1-like [Mercenaria mercenaria]|uniref:cytoglobin-1-like n=1 Tax=Mercenaria mercenaria TaxID=6596 RepID=UPI001E1DB22F|nr:cytoglobin-1-like [Mercenaria mercenaria]